MLNKGTVNALCLAQNNKVQSRFQADWYIRSSCCVAFTPSAVVEGMSRAGFIHRWYLFAAMLSLGHI